MKIWQVILATFLIFGSGVLTGALVVNHIHGPETIPLPYRPVVVRTNMPALQPVSLRTNLPAWPKANEELAQRRVQYLERISSQLDLTEQQRAEIADLLKDSHQRIRGISERIAPEVRKEIKETHDRFQASLTPEQRERFKELSRTRQQQRPPATEGKTEPKPRKAEKGEPGSQSRTNMPEALVAPSRD